MSLVEKVHRYPIIDQLEHEDLVAMLPYLNENEYPDGSVILEQGQVNGIFHIIYAGIVDISTMEDELEVSIAKLERGSFIGEISCLTGETVNATVRAEGSVRTLSMPHTGLLQLMDRNSSFRNHIIEAMIKRIGENNERATGGHVSSSVVIRQLEQARHSRYGPLVGDSLFMQGLREQINILANHEGPICIVGEKGVGKFHIASEIHYRSERSRHPIMSVDGASYSYEDWDKMVRAAEDGTIILEQADLFPTELLQRLVRSTGRARMIMTAKTMPEVKVMTVDVIPLRERAEDIPKLVDEFLVKGGIIEPREAITQEAMRMISLYPYLGDNIEGLKRVVKNAFVRSEGRMINNKHLRFDNVREPGSRPTIGLALGSGSVRGAAHVGVLKVLEEEGIPVDMIAGTSVGAFIGALYVGGQPISAFEEVLPTVRWGQLVNFALPPKAFVDNHKMARFLDKYIGSVDFEHLPIPFAVVASDAITGEACILNKGSVAKAICASTAIPGIMKPVQYHNQILVDGGVVHPVPVALARSMGADIVIAVDLSARSSTKKAPKNFVSAILNTIDVMSEKMVQEELQLADIVLNPQLDINEITFKASSAFIQSGVEATREAITSIKRIIDKSIN